jgi:hypothetical protein
MCTLSVVTRDKGYLLGMNRDEKIARGAGAPPGTRELGDTRVIYPSDGSGGTWIGVNERVIALALLNWNDVVPPAADAQKTRSRGLMIPALISSRSLPELRAAMDVMELEGMLPFRLVGVFPSERQIGEWGWNSSQTEFLPHGWESRHWFSSSLSDKEAERLRGATCGDAWNQPDAGSALWLRRLHASHAETPGPFSLCVHRSDVRTLSYTEIESTPTNIRMEHFVGSPCEGMMGKAIEMEQGHRLVCGYEMRTLESAS